MNVTMRPALTTEHVLTWMAYQPGDAIA